MNIAHDEAEAYALKHLARTWAGLAGQIDRYIKIMREQRGVVSAEGSGEQGLLQGGTPASRRSEMTDEDLVNERPLAVLQLLDSIPLLSPEQTERILNEVTGMLSDPKLLTRPSVSGRRNH